MPGALSQFHPKDEVVITCYLEGCGEVSVTVTLGQEYNIHPDFKALGHVGRLQWDPKAVMRGFELAESHGGSGYFRCPSCGTSFGDVVVVSNGRFKKPTIFGYDPEPA